jgi:hypothetical protein
MPLYVLINYDAELNMDLWKAIYESIKVVRVPRDYRSDLIGKGRAMHYFIENYVAADKWYCFIDDDNLLLDDNLYMKYLIMKSLVLLLAILLLYLEKVRASLHI